jgi:hypothetical protein
METNQSERPRQITQTIIVNEDTCKRYNSELMRVMINKKMRKSAYFSEFISGKNPKTDIIGSLA